MDSHKTDSFTESGEAERWLISMVTSAQHTESHLGDTAVFSATGRLTMETPVLSLRLCLYLSKARLIVRYPTDSDLHQVRFADFRQTELEMRSEVNVSLSFGSLLLSLSFSLCTWA